ncbi:2-polyprenyl-6-methoxyphenol hydroxylase [Bdellovibrio bacteriovorus]|uniref:Flavin-dependent monooxygenase n=1 Tax=Bdellovibrio bacteriovorus TaxID=959 RepID=A0A150WHT1_BDEBC|nr:NAD(P)/FAD-dependent oxidoreductase [Bdellovibrio bacteriovorus]KYG63223.1 2-polyprenyl-6-methoxyphenol hydroxylase [Bdellovibrio bacteriovorus]
MKTNLLKNKKIAIVGGGMAGLTLARLLQMQNVEVKVYERDFNRDVRVQGSTLDLHEGTGLEAMKRAGLLEEFYKNHRAAASEMLLVDRALNIKFDDHGFAKFTSETRPEIDRAPLRDILLNSLHPHTVVWDSRFSSMEKENTGWRIQFKNGTTAYADVVVAADGANSQVRPYLSSLKPVYSGVTLLQGDIDEAAKNTPGLFTFAKGGKVMAFDDEKMIGYGSKGDGSIMFVAAFKCSQSWLSECGIDFKNQDQVLSWFKKEFSTWSEGWQEFFTAHGVSFIPRPQYYFPLDQKWETQNNLTMIGDAAHRMPPFAGEGANVAMQDSFELADVLTNGRFSDIKAALAYFEQDMITRGADATRMTLENTEKMFSKTSLEQMLSFFKNVHGAK